MNKKLASFIVKQEQYTIYGDYVIEKGINYDSTEYFYPEFFELIATKTTEGKEIEFVPSGETWTGCKYKVENMISDFLMHTIIGNMYYKPEYIEPGLKNFIESYTKENQVEIIDGIKFPKKILSHDMYELYELSLVTNEYVYYMSVDQVIMLNKENLELISDNYFAEVGYNESLENIKNKTESLLWGELPEE